MKLKYYLRAVQNIISRIFVFVPGKYFFTVASPLEGEISRIGVFHHAGVDPRKLAKQFINMPDANGQHRDISNALTRRDFCKWAYFDDSKG